MPIPPLTRPFVVAFDMDGLIFNSEDLYDVAFGRFLEPIGRVFDRQLKLKMMGKRAVDVIQILKRETGVQGSNDQIHEAIESLFIEAVRESLEPMPGMLELFGKLDELKIPKAVVTSSRREMATLMLGQYELMSRIDFLLCGEEVTHGKPEPDIYLKAAELFAVSPTQMVVFEDSPAGNRAAVAAGAYAIAVPNIHTADCDFSGVKWIADTLADPRIDQLLFG